VAMERNPAKGRRRGCTKKILGGGGRKGVEGSPVARAEKEKKKQPLGEGKSRVRGPGGSVKGKNRGSADWKGPLNQRKKTPPSNKHGEKKRSRKRLQVNNPLISGGKNESDTTHRQSMGMNGVRREPKTRKKVEGEGGNWGGPEIGHPWGDDLERCRVGLQGNKEEGMVEAWHKNV